jgi:hypothetical protein
MISKDIKLDAILALVIEIAEAQRLSLPKSALPDADKLRVAHGILRQVDRGEAPPNLRLVKTHPKAHRKAPPG